MAPPRLQRQRDQPERAEEMVLSSLGAVLRPRRTQGRFSGQPLPQSSFQLTVASLHHASTQYKLHFQQLAKTSPQS
jgi:hypothetical protein